MASPRSTEPNAAGGSRPRSTARAAVLATVATAGAYGVSLLQQVLYARTLGVNAETDALAAALAWTIGTTGLVGTTLSSVLLPAYLRSAARSAASAAAVVGAGYAIAGGIAIVLALATFAAAPILAGALLPGLDPAHRERLVGLLRLTAPLQVVWVAVWVAIAIANARQRYVAAAASTILPPLPVIGLFLIVPAPSTEAVALAYTVGAVIQLGALALLARSPSRGSRAGKPEFGVGTAEIGGAPTAARAGVPLASRAVLTELGPRLARVGFAFALFGLAPLVMRAIASLEGPGALATSDYASRLVLAGEQVLLSGVLAVAFTTWSMAAAGSVAGPDAAAPPVEGGAGPVAGRLLQMIGLVVAVAVGLPLLAPDLVSLLLQGGRFSGADAARVGAFIGWMGPGVAAHMLVMAGIRALLARDRLVAVGVVSMVALAVLSAVAIVARTWWGLDGVAAGYSVGWLAAAAVTLAAVGLPAVGLGRELARALPMAAGAGAGAFVVINLVPDPPIARFAIASFVFVVTLAILARAFGVAAFGLIAGRLRLPAMRRGPRGRRDPIAAGPPQPRIEP